MLAMKKHQTHRRRRSLTFPCSVSVVRDSRVAIISSCLYIRPHPRRRAGFQAQEQEGTRMLLA